MSIPGDTWISTQEAARLLNCSERSIRRKLGSFQTRAVAGARGGRGGERYEILLESLPASALQRWGAEQALRAASPAEAEPATSSASRNADEAEAVARAYERADHRTRRYYDRWSAILLATEGIRGRRALQAAVDHWNTSHSPEHAISLQSLYRVRQRVEDHGRASLLLREDRRHKSTVTDEWFGWFREAYLHQGCVSAPDARRVALGRAKAAGQAAEDTFPSVDAFMRRLRNETPESLLLFARKGEKHFADRMGYAIERDYSDLRAGSVWVADTRTWDVFVRIEGQATPATCWITLFLDMKSYVPLGWHIHTTAPSTDNTLRAIRHGIERVGLPEEVYVDNGREYRSRDFSGQSRGHQICPETQYAESLAARLGFKMHFAQVKNARAKVIERQFLDVKNHFDRFWTSFKGGNVVEKPERLKTVLKAGDLPTIEEFREAANHFLAEVLPQIACHGKHHQGRTRAEILEAELAERPLRHLSAEATSWLVTRTAQGRVRHGGFRLAELDCWFWAEWMPVWKGKEITLRYDPDDLRVAWGYKPTGELIGECELRTAVAALVSGDDAIGKAQLRAQLAVTKHEKRLLRELAPQPGSESLSAMRHAYAAGVGARPLNLIQAGSLQVTRHDHDAAALRREKAAGRSDILSLVPQEPQAAPPRELRWSADLAATA